MWAELAACVHYGLAPWALLPKAVRKEIHSDGNTGDHGIDAVGESGIYAQVKWYDPESNGVKFSAITTLIALADALQARKSYPVAERWFILQEGMHLSHSMPAFVNRLVVKETILEALEEEGEMAVARYGKRFETIEPAQATGHAAFEQVQAECEAALWGLYESGQRVGKLAAAAELPTGSGKSYIIARLIARHLAEEPRLPVVLIEPRLLIMGEMMKLLENKGFQAARVDGSSSWSAGFDVYVVSGSSAKKLPDAFEASAVIYDEAHNATGREETEKRVERRATHKLSATLDVKADYRLTHSEAVTRGLVCDIRLVFAAFSRVPTYADIAAYLIAHPEHSTVLACFQTQKQARKFATEYNKQAGSGAESYTSDDVHSDALDRFRLGRFRVLCVVTRVEMGVNVHAIDTILLAEPWESKTRLRQLCGRGSRLHPTKPGYYSALCCVGPDESDEQHGVSRLTAMIREELAEELGNHGAERLEKVEVIPGEPHVGKMMSSSTQAIVQAIDTGYVDAIRITIYDCLGRVLPVMEHLRLRYNREREELRPLRLQSYEHFIQWRIKNSKTNFPEDPGDVYEPLGFSWDEYLGQDVVTKIEGVRRLVDDGLSRCQEQGLITEDDLEDVSLANLIAVYEILSTTCSRLPKDPRVYGMSIPQVFGISK